MFDTFDKSEDIGEFAVVNLKIKLDTCKLVEREASSKYIYFLLKQNFLSVVRITAIVILAARTFKKLLYLKRIRNNEIGRESLKELDFKPPLFSIFNVKCDVSSPVKTEVKLHWYFSADYSTTGNVHPCSINVKFPRKLLMIDNRFEPNFD